MFVKRNETNLDGANGGTAPLQKTPRSDLMPGLAWILEVLEATCCCSVTPYSSSSLPVGYLGCKTPNKRSKNSICPYINANCCHF